MRSRAGFTLLEVLVATVVMGIAVAGLIAGLSQSVRNAGRLSEYDRAAMLARTKMNDLTLDVTLPWNGSVEGRFSADEAGKLESGWRASLHPFESPASPGPGTLVLEEITLEVWWQPVTGTRHTIQLAGYRPTHVPFPPKGTAGQ